MRTWLALRLPAAVALSIALLSAGPPLPAPRVEAEEPAPVVKQLPTPADIYLLALQDARTLGAAARFTRYIFHPENQLLGVKTTSLTVNHDSRGPFIRRPVTLAGGLLSRIDLRWYGRTDAAHHRR